MVLELKSMMKGPVLEMAREVVKKGRRRAYKGAGAGDTACAYRPHGSFFGQSGALYAESGYKEDHSDEFKSIMMWKRGSFCWIRSILRQAETPQPMECNHLC